MEKQKKKAEESLSELKTETNSEEQSAILVPKVTSTGKRAYNRKKPTEVLPQTEKPRVDLRKKSSTRTKVPLQNQNALIKTEAETEEISEEQKLEKELNKAEGNLFGIYHVLIKTERDTGLRKKALASFRRAKQDSKHDNVNDLLILYAYYALGSLDEKFYLEKISKLDKVNQTLLVLKLPELEGWKFIYPLSDPLSIVLEKMFKVWEKTETEVEAETLVRKKVNEVYLSSERITNLIDETNNLKLKKILKSELKKR